MSAASESLTARLVLEPAELTAVHACLPPGMSAGQTPADVNEPGPVDERVLAGLRDGAHVDLRHHPEAGPVRRPSVLAVICVVLAAVSTGLLAGCDGGPPPGSEAAVARQKANDTVIRQLEALPGTKVSATIESSMDGGQNNIEVDAVLPATATTAELKVMADTLERTIWLSHLDPLGHIGLTVRRQGGTDPVLRRQYLDEIETRSLGVKYGPRPDGLPG